MAAPKVDRDALMNVIEGHSHKDDWGISVVSVENIKLLVDALISGDNPRILALHGRHYKKECEDTLCQLHIPYYLRNI